MSELTYLEINVKIATITGVVIEHITGNTIYIVDNETGLETGNDEYMEYNPRTDDSIIKRLMFEYEVTIIWSRNKVMMYHKPNVNPMKTVIIDFTDKSDLNLAILLAIIEAHNG